MEIRICGDPNEVEAGSVVVCPYFSSDSLNDVPALRDLGGERLAYLRESGHIRLDLYETFLLPPEESSAGLLLVGAGNRDDVDPFYLRRLFAAGSRSLSRMRFTKAAAVDRGVGSPRQFARSAVEGTAYGCYDAAIRKRRESTPQPLQLLQLITGRTDGGLTEGARLGQIVADAAKIARDLVNRPPNDLTPASFAREASVLAAQHGIGAEILDEAAIECRGMGSLMGVARGSDQPPHVIILRYGDPNATTKLALVGKGLTFDSGGLSLKTAEGMETMKSDMGGGAAVVAGMMAVARLAPAGLSVTGYVGLAENMPSGTAMRPGDVLTAMTGETIEVLNTDAEGRLVLADVLALAVQEGATHLVDIATLTGGAVVALGHAASLATGAPADWVSQVTEAAEDGMERVWAMPMYREYRKDMESAIADIKNSGGRSASALTASAFLRDFVGDVPWTHLDIAGTAWNSHANALAPEGGTGVGVGTIVSLVQRLSAQTPER